MITRRSFLKRAGVALAALGAGVKPLLDNKAPELAQSGVIPNGKSEVLICDESITGPDWPYGRSPLLLDNFGIAADSWESLDYHEDVMFLAGDDNRFTTKSFREQQRTVLNMPKLDSAGVDTVELRNRSTGGRA